MKDIIKNQLNKVRGGILPPFSENDTEILILRENRITINETKKERYYLMTISRSFTDNKQDSFAINWNKGYTPSFNQFKCRILQEMGSMIKVEAIDPVTDEVVSFWLPKKVVEKVEEI